MEEIRVPGSSVGRIHALVRRDPTVDSGDPWAVISALRTYLQLGRTPSGEMGGAVLARELLRVRGKDGKLKPLEANRVQLEYERRRQGSNIALKARQLGMTTWVAGRMFLRTILMPGSLSVQVAHNQTAAEEIFRIVQRFYANLPGELHAALFRRSRNNSRQMVFSRLDSEYRVESAADMNAGRGLTIQNLHCSEVARWPRNAAETMAGLRAALAPGGELVVESTPMGAQGCFYDMWRDAADSPANDGQLVRHFFPWWWEPSYIGLAVPLEYYTPDERELAEREGLTEQQIGFRRHLQQQFRGMAVQEFAEDAESCFLASGDCIFDAVALEQKMKCAGQPIEKREDGKLWIWFPPRSKKRYVVAVDPAGGGSDGDYSALQAVDVDSGLQCAEWQARMPVREAAQVVRRVAELYNRAVVAVERNNHGSGLLAHLEKTGASLYERNGILGWPTDLNSRPVMIERVGMVISSGQELFQSERLLRECRTFIRHRNGKSAAAAGCHDDCLMAMAIALSVRGELLEGNRI